MRIVLVTLVVALLTVDLGLRSVEDRVPAALEWENQFTQDKADRLAELGEVDVVVVGSSVANASIDVTDLLLDGEIGYNAALPSYTPRVWAEWFDDAILPTDPSLVVVAVDIRQYNDNKPGAESQHERYLASDGRRRLVDGGPGLLDRVGDAFAVSRLGPRLREPDLFLAAVRGHGDLGHWRDTNLDPWGRYLGFADRSFAPRPELLADMREGAFRGFSVGAAEEAALVRIVDSATAVGAEVVLVATPAMRTELLAALPGGDADWAAYEASVRRVAESTGVRLLDYADLHDRGELFADYYHMNDAGTEALGDRLAADLR